MQMEAKEILTDLSQQSSKEQVKPPSSVKKKKNYRVVESRYLKASKAPTPKFDGVKLESKGRGGTPSYKSPYTAHKETPQGKSKLSETLESRSICSSGIRISTPHKDIMLNDTPYLNCSEISSINSTLKDVDHHPMPLKNPSIRRPLLDSTTMNTKIKAVKQKRPIILKKDNFSVVAEEKNYNILLDGNNPLDLEIAYSQYLISHYLAVHAEKHLEIQEKDTNRLLFSLMESNKILADKLSKLKMESDKAEMLKSMEILVKDQSDNFERMKDSIVSYASQTEGIANSLSGFHNQILLKNVNIPDHLTFEQNLSRVSTQLANNLEEKSAINSLFEPLSNVTRDVLNDNCKSGNIKKICDDVQNISLLGSYQASLALQQSKPQKSDIRKEINTLLYNW